MWLQKACPPALTHSPAGSRPALAHSSALHTPKNTEPCTFLFKKPIKESESCPGLTWPITGGVSGGQSGAREDARPRKLVFFLCIRPGLLQADLSSLRRPCQAGIITPVTQGKVQSSKVSQPEQDRSQIPWSGYRAEAYVPVLAKAPAPSTPVLPAALGGAVKAPTGDVRTPLCALPPPAAVGQRDTFARRAGAGHLGGTARSPSSAS